MFAATLLGGLLGWLAGHVAVLLPRGEAGSAVAWRRAVSEGRVEHLTGLVLGAAIFGAASVYQDDYGDAAAASALSVLLIVTLLIDLRHHLVYPVMVLVGLILTPLAGEAGLLSCVIAAVIAATAFLLLFVIGLLLFRQAALGFGDVYLAAMIGAMVGLRWTPAALFLGIVLSALGGVLLLATRQKGMHDYLPFGSGMCLAAMIVLVLR